MKTSVILLAALALACPMVAHAQAQIDVNNLFVGSPSQGRVAATIVIGENIQTWTAGISGRLTQIDMFTLAYTNSPPNPSQRAIFEVYDAGSFGTTALSNIAGATLLGSVSMPLNAFPNGVGGSSVQSIFLSSLNINVQENQRLAFRMLAVCPSCVAESYWVNWNVLEGGVNANNYGGGKYFNPAFDFGAGVYAANDNVDLNFRTFVDPAAGPGAVPEPAIWAMLIAGFGLVGATARRRRAMVRAVAA
jgi:hypothetical protein